MDKTDFSLSDMPSLLEWMQEHDISKTYDYQRKFIRFIELDDNAKRIFMEKRRAPKGDFYRMTQENIERRARKAFEDSMKQRQVLDALMLLVDKPEGEAKMDKYRNYVANRLAGNFDFDISDDPLIREDGSVWVKTWIRVPHEEVSPPPNNEDNREKLAIAVAERMELDEAVEFIANRLLIDYENSSELFAADWQNEFGEGDD